jgi:hypothetical protein
MVLGEYFVAGYAYQKHQAKDEPAMKPSQDRKK